MEEKKKKSAQKHSLKSFLIRLVFFILSFPMLCGSAIWLVVTYDDIQMHQCGDEGEPLEWDGLLEYASPETQSPINQENYHRLSLLPYIDPVVFPEIPYNTAISHPEHDYFLSSNISNIEFYATPKLVLCQPDGWASHILSSDVRQYRFSPDGSFFAFTSNRKSLEIYDANRNRMVRSFYFYELTISNFAFHPTEPLIAFITLDSFADTGRLYLWNYGAEDHDVTIIDHRDFNRLDFLAFNEVGTFLIMRVTRPEPEILVWGIPPE